MSSTEFVHLHVHTDYSLLDGACPIYLKEKSRPDLVKLAREFNMSAMAITDHGFMGGAIEFYQKMNENKIKPIIGCEFYVSPTTCEDKNPDTPNIRGFHLILLAANFEGYQNLCRLLTMGNVEGFYYKARIDKQMLQTYSKGLIGLSACLIGEIPHYILKGKIKQAKKAIDEYLHILGRDNFYLEIMDHGIEEQVKVNKELILLSKEFNIPLVATNDVHYLKKEHARSHELMLCVQTNAILTDEERARFAENVSSEMTGTARGRTGIEIEKSSSMMTAEPDDTAMAGKKRFKFATDEFYLKSGDEMAALFKEVPQSIKNTLAVAEKCNLTIPFVPKVNHYPIYEISGSKLTPREYLKKICLDNMQDRFGFDPLKGEENLTSEQKDLLARVEYELDIIDKSKYCSYFLVVWDFIKFAREQNIPVGPGRGSGAGSIVAYLARITDIDPIRYQLLFERFLNPERVSPPDFDIDFCERRREEVIRYVRQKYGSSSVAQIGTYGTLKAKQVVKDIGRALGYSFDERNMITKIMNDDSLTDALEKNDDLKKLIGEKQSVRDIFTYSAPIEGLNRHFSIHAAGVIIGDQPLSSLVPLSCTNDRSEGQGKDIVTQYEAPLCESLGLLKMDFLGLRTLTIIQDALNIIRESRNTDIDISRISLRDKATYDLLNKGDTIAVFQLESGGMRDLCKKYGVSRIEDIIALIALYRPGPMQFIPDFINRKTGRVKVEYDHPKMEPVLKETYGIMLYQEQIMQVVQVLAGFTLGGADILRRAIGKKKAEELAAQKKKFVEGCASFSNIQEEKANAIWDKIEMFAGYGFNKSHSAAYAFLAYRTAFLKANYPVEFMTAVLTSVIDKADEIAFFIRECSEMEIGILVPDINSSGMGFTVDGRSIRFGLSAIKGVGEAASTIIIKSREADGKFKSIADFAERVGTQLNTRVLENLTRAGAFDSMGLYRSQLLEMMPLLIVNATKKRKDKEAGQGSLFDMFASGEESSKQQMQDVRIPSIPELHERDMLNDEKALLGFYVSGHPWGEYARDLEKYITHSVSDLNMHETNGDTGIRAGGMITNLEIKNTKRDGSKFAIFTLEDTSGNIECMISSRKYEEFEKNGQLNFKEILAENHPLFFEGTLRLDEQEAKSSKKISVEKIIPIGLVPELYTDEIHIHIHEASSNNEMIATLRKILGEHHGATLVILCVTCAEGEKVFIESSEDFKVKVSKPLLHEIKAVFGEECIRIKANKKVAIPENGYRHRYSRVSHLE